MTDIHAASLKSIGYSGELGNVCKDNINPHSRYTDVSISSCKTAVPTHIRKKNDSFQIPDASLRVQIKASVNMISYVTVFRS